jgi:hypothetical protein
MLEEFLVTNKISRLLISLLKLLIINLSFAHLIACIWIFYYKSEKTEINWVSAIGLERSNWYSIYINAYYFAIITMTTVGFGDIAPKNDVEKVICIVIILLYIFQTII